MKKASFILMKITLNQGVSKFNRILINLHCTAMNNNCDTQLIHVREEKQMLKT